jgi:hypothetical protein
MERRNKTWLAAALVALAGAAAVACTIANGHARPPQKDMHIDAATRAEVVAAVIANVSRDYVYPEQAARMSARLQQQLAHGDFDKLTSADDFADALTDSLRLDNHDRHLQVGYSEDVLPVPQSDDESAVDAAAFLAERKRFNFGFETVGRLPCDIGYLDLHEFGRPDQVRSRLEAAMTLLSDTRGLIIDLRRTHGGDPDTVMKVASYLYDQPTHLNDIWYRDENRLESRWTTEQVAGLRYGQSRPVYLLTSEDTFSAGEDFAYALKNNGRAVLVGETTGGGAHPGNVRRLSAHFQMNVPSGRTISPVTKTDWEGVGVSPDVHVRAAKALDVAQVALLKKLLPQETDPEWQRKIRDRISDLD